MSEFDEIARKTALSATVGGVAERSDLVRLPSRYSTLPNGKTPQSDLDEEAILINCSSFMIMYIPVETEWSPIVGVMREITSRNKKHYLSKRPFLLRLGTHQGTCYRFSSWEDFASSQDPRAVWCRKFTTISEGLFWVAQMNPYLKFNFAPQWTKLAKINKGVLCVPELRDPIFEMINETRREQKRNANAQRILQK